MMGRPPLPTHLKLVKGTARVDRHNPNELKLPLVVPDPPPHLDEREKAKFKAMAELLARHGVMPPSKDGDNVLPMRLASK